MRYLVARVAQYNVDDVLLCVYCDSAFFNRLREFARMRDSLATRESSVGEAMRMTILATGNVAWREMLDHDYDREESLHTYEEDDGSTDPSDHRSMAFPQPNKFITCTADSFIFSVESEVALYQRSIDRVELLSMVAELLYPSEEMYKVRSVQFDKRRLDQQLAVIRTNPDLAYARLLLERLATRGKLI